VARTNPLGKIKDVALGTLLHPVGTAGKAVEQAKGTAAIGRMVAGQVTRAAASVAVDTVGGVARRTGGAGQQPAPSTPAAERATRGDEPNLRAVPSVNEPAHTAAPAARKASKTAAAEPVTESTKNHGDLLAPVQEAVKKAPAKKSAPAAKKAAAKKPVAKKAPAKKATAEKSEPTTKKTAKKAAKKATNKATSTEPGLIAKKTPATKLAEQGLDDVTPADVAKVAKKTPAKKTTPVQAVEASPAPEKETAERTAPRTASEVANEEGPALTTPVGTTAAGESAMPNTDLQQPGTEPLMDPATVNAVKSEAETMQRAADPDKG
jgi:hypothetical protein